MPATRIHIADAQFLVRKGIRSLINGQADLEVVSESTNDKELKNALDRSVPDVVIIDYTQVGYFSKQTIEKILQHDSAPKILVVSNDSDPTSMYSVLGMGINSFLTKHCEGEEILNALRATARGDRFFCNKVLDLLMDRNFPREKDNCQPTPLTNREMEIVQLTATGMVAKEIANALDLSTHTIYTHRKNIMRKLDVRSSAELVHQAMKLGIIDEARS